MPNCKRIQSVAAAVLIAAAACIAGRFERVTAQSASSLASSPCNSNPCQNGGACESFSLDPDGGTPVIFTCRCPVQFTGSVCGTFNPTAMPTVTGPDVAPIPNATANGAVAPTATTSTAGDDACQFAPCANGGTCVRTAIARAGFLCECAAGFGGAQCQFPAAASVSACSSQNHCSNNRGACALYEVTNDPNAPPLATAVHPTGSSDPVTPVPPQCRCPIGYLRADCSVAAPLRLCPDAQFCILWSYDPYRIDVQIVANTTGWFGVVLNSDPAIISGGGDPLRGDGWWFQIQNDTNGGRVVAMDAFAIGQSAIPQRDASQELFGVTGYQQNGQSIVSFSRAICTGDAQDTSISPDAMIVAYVLGRNESTNGFEAIGNGASAALWSMQFFAFDGIGAPTSAPRALTAERVSQTSITVVWSTPACASTSAPQFYEIGVTDHTNASSGGSISSPLFPTLLSTVQLVGLTPATNYSIRIRANNEYGSSPFAVLNVTTLTNDSAAAVLSPPKPPTLQAATEDTLTLTYAIPSDMKREFFNSFVLQMKPTRSVATASSGAAQPADWRVVCAGSIPSCVVRGLTPEQTLSFRLAVVAVSGMSPFSPEVKFQTAPRAVAPPTAIGSPLGVRCANSDSLSVNCGVRATSAAPILLSSNPPTTLQFAVREQILFLRVQTTHRQSWTGIGFGASADDGMSDLDALILYPTSMAAAESDEFSGATPAAAAAAAGGAVTTSIRCERRVSNTHTTPELADDQICRDARAWNEPDSVVYLFERPLARSSDEPHTHAIEPGFTRLSIAFGRATNDASNLFEPHPPRAHNRVSVNFFTGEVTVPRQPPQWKLLVWGVALVVAIIGTLILTRTRWGTAPDGWVQRRVLQPKIGPSARIRSNKFDRWVCFDFGAAFASLSIGECILLLCYTCAFAVYVGLAVTEYQSYELDPAGVLGQLTAIHATITLLLPTRNSVWAGLFFSSFERLVSWHRRAGRLFWVFALAHGLQKWSKQNYALSYIAETTPTSHGSGNLFGPIAFIFFTAALIPAFEVIRRRYYDAFKVLHLLALIGVALAMVHSIVFRYLAIAPLILIAIDWSIRLWQCYRQSVRVLNVDRISSGHSAVTKLTLLPHNGFTFAAGQYLFINVPSISRWAWHPFSISSAPAVDRGGAFTLHVRDMSTARVQSASEALRPAWSHSLWSIAGTPDELTRATGGALRMHGPYGRLSVQIERYPVIVLIAGGIGATPLVSILLDIQRRHAATLAAGSGAAGGSGEFAGLRGVHFIWTCSTPAPFHYWFDALSAIEKAANASHFKVSLHSTDRHAPDSSAAGGGIAHSSRLAVAANDSKTEATPSPPPSAGAVHATTILSSPDSKETVETSTGSGKTPKKKKKNKIPSPNAGGSKTVVIVPPSPATATVGRGSGGSSGGGSSNTPFVDLPIYTPNVQSGARPDFSVLLESIVRAYNQPQAPLRPHDICVVSCGPKSMTETVTALCHVLQLHHHTETFAL